MGKKSRRRKKGKFKSTKLTPSERLKGANNRGAWRRVRQLEDEEKEEVGNEQGNVS